MLLVFASVAHGQGSHTSAADCQTLTVSVLQPWGFPNVPTDATTACCSNALATAGHVVCDATKTFVTELHLTGMGLVGQVPGGVQLLTHLTTVDISNNPDVTTGLTVFSGLPALTTLNAAGCNFTGPVPQFASSISCSFSAPLCGTPGCNQLTPPLPACPATQAPGGSNTDATAFVAPTASTTLYILIAVFSGILLGLSIMCCFCNQRGAVAKRLLELQDKGKGTASTPVGGGTAGEFAMSGVPQSVQQQQHHQQQILLQQDQQHDVSGGLPASEMAMITLSRNGIPKRTFSLPETRALQSKEEAALDVSAREPFIAANGLANGESFPVRRFYVKEMADELSLTEGDSVVLTKVFRDGWAEGVSKRAGGPALFPLACLGGGVPLVLAERLRIARIMARGGSAPGS